MAESTRSTRAAGKAGATEQDEQKAPAAAAPETADPQPRAGDDPAVSNPAATGEGTVTAGTGEDSVLVKVEDRIEDSVFDSSGSADELVTIQKDVVEEFYYPNTKRPAQRILFVKGQVVRRAYIDALNARVDALAAATEETKLEDYVDATTIAAGTGSQPPLLGEAAKDSDKE